jgi:hypothetical protein
VFFVRAAVQVASALSSAVQVEEEQRREEFVSSRGLLAAIKVIRASLLQRRVSEPCSS